LKKLKKLFTPKRGSVQRIQFLLSKLKNHQAKRAEMDLPRDTRLLVLTKDPKAERAVAKYHRKMYLVERHIQKTTKLLEREIKKLQRKLKLPKK
jgi:hypothetical protein